MPQIILLALAGVGAYATYKWASKQLKAPGQAGGKRDAAKAPAEPRDLGSLRRDPLTGEFRPE